MKDREHQSARPRRKVLRAAALVLLAGVFSCATPERRGPVEPEPTPKDPPAAPELVVQSMNDGGLSFFAPAPGGRFLLIGFTNGSVRLQDMGSGKIVRFYTGAVSNVTSAAFSPDGASFAAGHADGTVRILAVETGKEVRRFSGPHPMRVSTVAFSPDGGQVLSGSPEGTLKVFDAASSRTIRTVSGFAKQAGAVAFTKDGRLGAAPAPAGGDGYVLRSLRSGFVMKTFAGIEKIGAAEFSPDGSLIALGSSGGPLQVFDTGSGKKLWSSDEGKGIDALAFSPDGFSLAAGSRDGRLRLLNARTGAVKRTFVESGRMKTSDTGILGIGSVVFSPDGRHILYGTPGGKLMVLDAETGEPAGAYASEVPGVRCAAILPNGNSFLIGSHNTLRIWSIAAGKEEKTIQLETGSSVFSAAVSPDGKLALAGMSFSDAKLCDTGTGKVLRELKSTGSGSTQSAAAFSPDGRLAATGLADDTVRLWDTASGRELRILRGHTGTVNAVVFSRDGKSLFSGSRDGTVKLWETETGRLVAALEGHAEGINAIALSPDGKRLLSGSYDRTVRLWDLADRGEIMVMKGHSGGVTAVAFSPDGEKAMSGSLDATARLWDLRGGKEVRRFKGHAHFVNAVAFLPDGGRALSASSDGTVRLWDLAEGNWTAFVSGLGAWLVYTHDGYWDGAEDCSRLVAMVRGTENWNIDQFAVRNNRPDIILNRLGSRDETLISHFHSLWRKRLRRAGISETEVSSDYAVPSAEIAAEETEGKKTKLKLEFSSKERTLKSYQVYANDVPLFGPEGKPLTGRKAFVEESVELVDGANKIEASCMDSGGSESYRASRTVAWKGGVRPRLYYLAFGVSDYADPAVTDLSYAAKDALDLESAFKAMTGDAFETIRSRVLVDAGATKKALLEASDFLREARPDDVFVLFLAGHGVQAGSAEKADEFTYYYLTSDAVLADLGKTAVAFAAVEDLLYGAAPRRKLFLMDTCESGERDEAGIPSGPASAGGRGRRARTLRPEKQRGIAVIQAAPAEILGERGRWIHNDLVRRSGAVVFSSSKGTEASLESDEWRQGAFTAKILEALRGKADADADRAVDFTELRDFVARETAELTGGLQHPTVDRDNLYAKISFPVIGGGR